MADPASGAPAPRLPRPPRALSPGARLAVLFGGVLALVGSIVTGVGLVFFWVFVANSELRFAGSEDRAWQEVEARVVVAEETSASENDVEVVRYVYEYQADGRTHAGRAYTTGWRWDEGQSLRAEFDPSEPEVSRVPGARRAMFGKAAGFAGVFPLIGVLLLVAAILRNRRHLRLLVHGVPARGRVVGRAATATTINDRRVYRYTIEYQTAGGRTARFDARTHRTELVEDEETEGLLYDPGRPDRGALLDTLPVVPEPGRDGVLRVTRRAALASLTAPALCLLPHAAWAIWRYAH